MTCRISSACSWARSGKIFFAQAGAPEATTHQLIALRLTGQPEEAVAGTLGEPGVTTVPVVGLSYAATLAGNPAAR